MLPLHGEGLDGGPVRGTVAGYLADDRLVAVVGFGAARWVARYRALVADAATRTDTLAHAATRDPGGPTRRNDHGQRNILRSTARAIRLPTAISP